MLGPLEETFPLGVQGKADVSKSTNLWTAVRFRDKPLWVVPECTLSPQGGQRNHLDRLLCVFLLDVPSWTELCEEDHENLQQPQGQKEDFLFHIT